MMHYKLGNMVGLSQICSNFFPKCFQELLKHFTHYVTSVFLLCLHYVPKLATFVTIVMEHLISECSIRVFQYNNDCSIREYQSSKELCTMHLCALLQFTVPTDCFIVEYRSIFMVLSSIV